MAEDTENGDNKEVAVETSLGKLRVRGYHLGNVLQIVAAVLLSLMAMMMYEMRAETKATAAMVTTATRDSIKELSASTKMEHDIIAKAIERGADSQAEMNFILTLSAEERSRLRLEMPESLRRKLRER